MAGMIEYPADGRKAQGYLAGKENKGLIVIQEWWGLAPHIKDVTDRFAAAGYLALAPDLWDGKLTKAPDEAQRLLMALDIDDYSRKIEGAVAALRVHGAEGKVGIVGFCMGGQLALYSASKLPDDIGACVNFYGIHPRVKPDYASLKAPVMAVFAEKDDFVPVAEGEAIAKAIRDAGGTCRTYVYPGAGHAFFNDTRPEAYHESSAKDVWPKTLDFLAQNL